MQGDHRSLKFLKVLKIHHHIYFFKALKFLKNSTYLQIIQSLKNSVTILMEQFYCAKFHRELCYQHSHFCDAVLKSLSIKSRIVLDKNYIHAGKSLKSP